MRSRWRLVMGGVQRKAGYGWAGGKLVMDVVEELDTNGGRVEGG